MFNKEYIFNQLKEMGAPRDSIVFVHSSLKAIGEVEGRADGLIDILKEYFTAEGGLLCIPTHTWAFGNNGEIKFDLMEPKTCIGTLPNVAAKREDMLRTMHPSHSMAIFGDREKAEAFAMGENEIETPTSKDGCYGKLFKNKGYVLLVGVGHNRNTYLHSVEEMLDLPNRISEDKLLMKTRLKDGSIIEEYKRYHKAEGINDVSARYPKFEPAFRLYGAIKDGFIGNAKTQLCSAVKMKEVLELIYSRTKGEEILFDFEPLDEKYYK